MSFFFEVLIGGLLSGVMYSLVALGFVLIYKASGVFNFAQGAMVFFAALTYVGLLEMGLPPWAAVPATLVVMIVLGLLTERFVLRPLVNQPQITLFMATIGLTFLIEGLAQIMWGANVRGLELGLQDEPIQWVTDTTGMSLSKFDLVAAGRRGGPGDAARRSSSTARGSGARCARWPTIIRRRSPSASRCSRSGRSFGASPARWRWSRASCGARATASSSR